MKSLLLLSLFFAQTGAPHLPDLNGFWNNQYTPNLAQALGHEPPYTPYGLERWKKVDTKNDPTGLCLPVGPSRAFTAPMPFQFVQGPDMIALLFEYQTIYRMVYMDGRPHPPDIREYPEFMGHSIGHWEGDTLVIDTVGINERSWLDTAGHEHSAQLHLIERLQKIDDNHLKWTVTYNDPVFFTQPWSITRTFTRGKPTDRIMTYSCEENNIWMISNGQMTNKIRGTPMGAQFRMGSFPPGAALGPYPGLLASYLACPRVVRGGKLSPGP